MDYFGLIKKAYKMTLEHRFLWIFGLFASAAGGYGANWLSGSSYQPSETDYSKYSGTMNEIWTNFGTEIIIGLIILFIISIIFFVLSVVSDGALVSAVSKLSKEEKTDFGSSFKIGLKNFWRIWGTMIIYLLMILASLCIWIMPVSLLVIINSYILAVIWGLLFLFICLAFWILIGLIAPYSLRVIVLQNKGVWDSIRESLHLVRENLAPVVLMYLILFAVNIGFSAVFTLAILIAGGLLGAIGFGIFLASPIVAIVYGVIAAIAFCIALVLISAAYSAFYSSVITLTYEKLKK